MNIVAKAIALIDIALNIGKWKLQNEGVISNLKQSGIECQIPIYWTGTAADLVEFAYGAIEASKLNHGDIDLNDAIEQLCLFFSFEVKDCYDTFRAIRRRVGSRTLFLDEMIDKLNQRMDDMDNGIFKKKKIRRN